MKKDINFFVDALVQYFSGLEAFAINFEVNCIDLCPELNRDIIDSVRATLHKEEIEEENFFCLFAEKIVKGGFYQSFLGYEFMSANAKKIISYLHSKEIYNIDIEGDLFSGIYDCESDEEGAVVVILNEVLPHIDKYRGQSAKEELEHLLSMVAEYIKPHDKIEAYRKQIHELDD